MKPTLQLNIGQQLTLTPQLQQAIRLLQLSSLDLQQEVEEFMLSNPMLETNEEENKELQPSRQDDSTQDNVLEMDKQQDIPQELAIDSAWEDILQTSQLHKTSQHGNETDDYEKQRAHSMTLHDYLHAQMNLMHLSDTDCMIANNIIDAINEQGLLSCSLDDIHAYLNKETSSDNSIELTEIETVLQYIQQVDPIGIGARDLRECLLIQLSQLPANTPWVKEAHHIVDKYFDLLGKRDYLQLARVSKYTKTDLEHVLSLIQELNPRPANQVGEVETHYIIPDVIVSKRGDDWIVKLNEDNLPKLRINKNYSALIERNSKNSDNHFLRTQLQEARWFLKSLQSRNETLLKVANYLFTYQQTFLEHGAAAMKPLVLHQVADAVGMHESTISRVTTQKYAETPHGIFELKYFFSSHIDMQDGNECSSTAIRALIRKLIDEEDNKKPLSDSKLTHLLANQGIQVARRTVAKYRETLHIPSSNERRSLV